MSMPAERMLNNKDDATLCTVHGLTLFVIQSLGYRNRHNDSRLLVQDQVVLDHR